MDNKIILVDIDGTIYNANTTFDFLDYYFNKERDYRIFRKWSCSLFGRVINKLSILIFHIDIIRTIGIRRLNGYDKSTLMEMGEKFYVDVLVDVKHKAIIDAVKDKQDKGKSIVLASATLDFLAEMIATKLHADRYICTELNYHEGVCSGRMKKDRLGHKIEALREIGIQFPVGFMFTDNITDSELLQECTEGFVIVYPSERTKWFRYREKYHLNHIHFIQHEEII